ncbi:hypothetical protein [Klebsiella pneumoniae]|uniref:hypothetical protein n=1 Tax=Klebsiella pneumoniae TaxID=573 RepID=UPI0035BC8019
MSEKLLFRDTENGKPVYQMRMLDNSAEAEQWVEVSEREFHTPLKDPSVWEKRVLYATSCAEPPAPDAAFLDEARMCAFILEQIGSMEADDLDSDTVELRFELNGVDTGSDVSITDYAARASEVISQLLSFLTLTKRDDVTYHKDDIAFDHFATACKAKLENARVKGRGGWEDPEQCTNELLAKLLVGHLLKGNAGTFEDVANFAMMLHQRGADPQVLVDAAKGERFTPAEREAVARALNTPNWSEKLVATLDRTISHLQKGYSTDIAREHVLNDVMRGRALLTDAVTPLKNERESFNLWNNDTDCPLAGRDAKAAAWLAWCLRGTLPGDIRRENTGQPHDAPLAFAYRELTPQLMRNHLFVFERYGLIPKDESTVIQALRIALDGMNRRGGNRPGELHPGIAEFYCADQNLAGKFELSEDCMCAIASLLDGGFTLPDSLRERCEQIVAGQFSYKLQELAHLVLTTENFCKAKKHG